MKKEKLQKYLTIAFFIGAFILLVFLIQTYGIEPLRSAVKEMGIWAPLGILILRGISVILPALPSSVYSLLAGSLLGFKTGYLTIFISDLIFCQIAFFIARNFGRSPVRKLVGIKAMKRIESFNQNQLEGNFFLMTGLLMTGLFDFLSYALGIGGTRWRLFTPALIISLLISDSIIVAVGAGVSQGAGLMLGGALLGMFALATITGFNKNKVSETQKKSQ
ncbi:TVP38/TMEM64 family protein [Prochlorococcus marinus]|uniref:TVP38/TMEM64 family protein n=1 Tax=Prochlorococcus marinus TaxID=1219 RepID=UPI0022B37F04|nr:VTT domain-containing protein [Prochlorococcus marinus]